MVIVRNPQVNTLEPPIYNVSQKFLTDILDVPILLQPSPLGKATAGYIVHFLSRTECNLPVSENMREFNHHRGQEKEGFSFSLLMQALHAAFAEHIPFSLSPEIVWYLIAHEIAIHIRLNKLFYANYFIPSWIRGSIHFQDDSLRYGAETNDWGGAINRFRGMLATKIPKPTIDLMLPRFSSSTGESDTALLVLFLDIASNYYDIVLYTICGIPAVRLEGTAEDWQTVIQHTEMARSAFVKLAPYFDNLLPILKEIAGTAAGDEPDPEFWSSIYKFGNRCDGPYISGWITAFFAHRLKGNKTYEPIGVSKWPTKNNITSDLKTKNLPTHISKVPFIWNYHWRKHSMVFIGGIMGVEYDGFLTPRLGYGVLEKGKL